MSVSFQQQYRISVFGSSKPIPGDPEYQSALDLGAKLALSGFAVLTGGYIGTMEAISKGANTNGGHVIGVTCEEIEVYRPIGPNPWIHEEIRTSTLRERISVLINQADACIALPGGVGTLTEIVTAWNHILIGAVETKPLLLIGPGWKSIFDGLFISLREYIPINQRNLVGFVQNNLEVVNLLVRYFEEKQFIRMD